MTNQPPGNLHRTSVLVNRDEESSRPLQDDFGCLCNLEHLQLAFAQVKKGFPKLGLDPSALEAFEAKGTVDLLRQLGEDLQARSYRPDPYQYQAAPATASASATKAMEDGDIALVRDQVVRAALGLILDAIFPAETPCDPEPEKVVQWIARAVERGLTRAYEIAIDESVGDAQSARLLERARRRIGDADILALLETFLRQTSEVSKTSEASLLQPGLTNIAFEGIDRALQKLTAIGRQGDRACIVCGRFGNDVVILWDRDVQYDWVLLAVKKRLGEELAELGSEIDPTKVQAVDLARGDKLRVMGFELQAVVSNDGVVTTHCKSVEPETVPREGGILGWLWRWKLPQLRTSEARAKRKIRQERPAPDNSEDRTGGIRAFLADCIETAQAGLARSTDSLARACAEVGRYIARRWKFAGAVACGACLVLGLILYVKPPTKSLTELPLYPVQGKVFLNGEPAAGALVVFHPREEDGQKKPRPSARVAEDGSFFLGTYVQSDGAPPDSYAVTVTMALSKTDTIRPSDVQRAKSFPGRYGEPDTTPLAVTLEAKPTEIPPFELVKKAPAPKKKAPTQRPPS